MRCERSSPLSMCPRQRLWTSDWCWCWLVAITAATDSHSHQFVVQPTQLVVPTGSDRVYAIKSAEVRSRESRCERLSSQSLLVHRGTPRAACIRRYAINALLKLERERDEAAQRVAAHEAARAVMADWDEVLDDTGAVYFYNRVTGESRWESPVGAMLGGSLESNNADAARADHAGPAEQALAAGYGYDEQGDQGGYAGDDETYADGGGGFELEQQYAGDQYW